MSVEDSISKLKRELESDPLNMDVRTRLLMFESRATGRKVVQRTKAIPSTGLLSSGAKAIKFIESLQKEYGEIKLSCERYNNTSIKITFKRLETDKEVATRLKKSETLKAKKRLKAKKEVDDLTKAMAAMADRLAKAQSTIDNLKK